MNQQDGRIEEQLKNAALELIRWLLDDALPLWQTAGQDPETGGFEEAISPDTGQAAAMDRRARVQPRQIYAFIEGGRLGWPGPWARAARRGYDWFCRTYFLPNGTIAALASADGRRLDDTFDLYNQAFALFALAHIAGTFPDLRDDALARAHALYTHLNDTYRHPVMGFRESNPDSVPLRSNPHMHLLEAARALEAVDPGPVWSALADEIADLALTRFIDPKSGGLREFFDADWAPMPDETGRIIEPGHQFEWAWLLVNWGLDRGKAPAMTAARRLYQIGSAFGIETDRQVAVMALNDDFSVHDPVSRLWGQTEWIKAAVALADISSGPERDMFLADTVLAVNALQKYVQDVPAGLWRDKLDADGRFDEAPSPASSFYHIVCAISELHAFCARL
ncbi:MAG: AGE family epimerase/isomerase [Roseibium sp.]|nr:AGE family epimerase/isomerase [Roseibium sp.]